MECLIEFFLYSSWFKIKYILLILYMHFCLFTTINRGFTPPVPDAKSNHCGCWIPDAFTAVQRGSDYMSMSLYKEHNIVAVKYLLVMNVILCLSVYVVSSAPTNLSKSLPSFLSLLISEHKLWVRWTRHFSI